MNREYLLEALEAYNWPNAAVFGRKKELQSLKSEIIEATKFLPTQTRTSFRIRCIIEGIDEIPLCVCGTLCKVNLNLIEPDEIVGHSSYYAYNFSTFCSRTCMRKSEQTKIKRMATMIDRYGDHNMRTEKGQEEFKQAFFARHGVDNPLKCDQIKNKILKTNMSRYGVKHLLQHPVFIKKAKQTMIERYGVDHPMKSDVIKSKIVRNNLEKYGVINPSKRHLTNETLRILESKDELSQLYATHGDMGVVGDIIGCHRSSIQRAMTDHEITPNKSYNTSQGEKEICSFLDSNGISYKTQVNVDGCVVDIMVGDRIIIEYNGVYWHSSKFKEKMFHQNRTLLLQSCGYTVIHVWEDDWKSPAKNSIVKNKIMSKIGGASDRVFARKCEVRGVDYKKAHEFMETNHIQGKTTASKWAGLFYCGELVACIGIKKLSKHTDDYDLVRYATSKNVIGGFSKILSYLKKLTKIGKVVTFASLDYGSGDLYNKTGFTSKGVTPPCLWYVVGGQRVRRERFMKHKLNTILTDFDPNLTANENLINNRIYPLYDSGSIKFEMVVNN